MQDVYAPCFCGSGEKYKFCCYKKYKDPYALLKESHAFEIYECFISEGWDAGGLATAVVVRKLPNGKYLIGTYLVDVFCLGLKNTFYNVNVDYDIIVELLDRAPQKMVKADYENIRSITLGAIEYAGKLGFKPDKDWDWSRYIIEYNRPFDNKYTFGKDGRPLYVSGPDDDVEAVMKKLGIVDKGFIIKDTERN